MVKKRALLKEICVELWVKTNKTQKSEYVSTFTGSRRARTPRSLTMEALADESLSQEAVVARLQGADANNRDSAGRSLLYVATKRRLALVVSAMGYRIEAGTEH